MANIIKTAKQLIEGYGNLIRKGNLTEKEKQIALERLDLCAACPHKQVVYGIAQCSICHCPLEAKVVCFSCSCPLPTRKHPEPKRWTNFDMEKYKNLVN